MLLPERSKDYESIVFSWLGDKPFNHVNVIRQEKAQRLEKRDGFLGRNL